MANIDLYTMASYLSSSRLIKYSAITSEKAEKYRPKT